MAISVDEALKVLRGAKKIIGGKRALTVYLGNGVWAKVVNIQVHEETHNSVGDLEVTYPGYVEIGVEAIKGDPSP